MRMVGACKEGTEDYFKPTTFFDSKVPLHPFHDHIFTFLKGTETDVTTMFPVEPLPSARVSLAEVTFRENLRDSTYPKASYLQHIEENELRRVSLHFLHKAGLTSGYDLGRLSGCRIRADTKRTTGRYCVKGRHHESNSFYVEFKRSGDITYNCYGTGCRNEPPKRIGEWCDTVYQMLDSDQFAPGNNVDTVLLKNLESLAIKAAPGKTAGARYANVKSTDFFPQLEEVVATYLSHFFVFVSNPSVYVKQYWEDGQVQDFKEYTVDKLKNVVKPYKWSFDIWDNSYLREQLGTKLKFVGCPFEDRVADNEYNKCVNAMPFLKLPHVPPSSGDLETIEPLLTHIREALCAGVVDDYEQFIAWVAHIAQKPDVKIGWCPLFMSEQGTGKGLVLGTLLPNIFDKLALHVTNFSSVVERYVCMCACSAFLL